MGNDNLTDNDIDTTTSLHNDTEPATKHDVGIGGGLGAVGGAIVGGLAGGPLGAVIGAIAGGAASAGAVDIVDKHDHDYDRTVTHTATTDTVPAYTAEPTLDDSPRGTATEYTGPGDFQRTQPAASADTNYDDDAVYAGTTTPHSVDADTAKETSTSTR